MEKKDKIQSICVDLLAMNTLFPKIMDRLLRNDKKKISSSKRQIYYQDYGVNGGQCCSRHNKLTEMTGISKPLLMTGSTDPFVTKVIVWLPISLKIIVRGYGKEFQMKDKSYLQKLFT